MKKVVKKTKEVNPLKRLETLVEKLAIMSSNNFERLDHRIELESNHLHTQIKKVESDVGATRQEVLNLHDKFIHRREFDELVRRVSKVEEKLRK